MSTETSKAEELPTLNIEAILEKPLEGLAQKLVSWQEAQAKVDALEAQIKARQEEIAEQMRGQNEALYTEADLAFQNYEDERASVEQIALDAWEEAGKPAKKMYGDKSIKISESIQVEILDEREAIIWCQNNGHQHLLSTKLDARKFKQGIKDEFVNLEKLGDNVATREIVTSATIQKPALSKLAK